MIIHHQKDGAKISPPSFIPSLRHQHRMGQRLPRPAAAQAELRRPVEAQPGGRRHGEEAAPAGGMEVAWALKKTMEIHGKRKWNIDEYSFYIYI